MITVKGDPISGLVMVTQTNGSANDTTIRVRADDISGVVAQLVVAAALVKAGFTYPDAVKPEITQH